MQTTRVGSINLQMLAAELTTEPVSTVLPNSLNKSGDF